MYGIQQSEEEGFFIFQKFTHTYIHLKKIAGSQTADHFGA